jgi:hypothetical protein
MKNIFVGSITVYASLLCASPAFCDETVQGIASGSINTTPISFNTGVVSDPQLAILPEVFLDQGGFGVDRMSALAGNGHVQVLAQATGDTGVHFTAITNKAEAIAGYSDNLTFHNLGGAPGAEFVVTGSWNLSGSTEAGATAPNAVSVRSFASAGAQLTLWGNGVVGHLNQQSALLAAESTEQVSTLGTGGGGINPPSSIPVSFVVRVGSPFHLTITLDALASAVADSGIDPQNPGTASADSIADFSHTLSWGGITSVTDSDGNPITDWTVTSDSGFDYSQPFVDVPEPSTLAFLAIALPGLLLVSRYCRQRRNA